MTIPKAYHVMAQNTLKKEIMLFASWTGNQKNFFAMAIMPFIIIDNPKIQPNKQATHTKSL